MQTSEAVYFAEADPYVTTTQITHSCLVTVPCQWASEGNHDACGTQLACSNVPAHLGDTHGVRKLGRDTQIYCKWEGCHKWVKRRNIVRHIRECHLGHAREKKHAS
ncbi:hypothetical protein OG21DRAFT_1139759 [Imleria badia]|nr:hypothetical protein OG21DRAFT_1139759 [Imleria badia]